MMKLVRMAMVLCMILAAAGFALGEEGPAAADAHLEIGKVKFFRSQNRIEVPGVVTVDRSLIELFACSEGGKAHESVLVLDCRPSNLNLAMKLMGLDDGGQTRVRKKVPVRKNGKVVEEEREVLEENGPNFPGDPRRPMGERVIVTVHWKVDGEERVIRAEDMVYEKGRNRTMPRAGWIYVGSCFVNNPLSKREELGADHSRTIMTTWHDPTTLLDNPLPDGGDDEVYYANPEVVPPRGTAIVMQIRRPTKEEASEAEKVEDSEKKAAEERKGKEGEKR